MRARGWIWTVLVVAFAAFAGLRLASGRALETDLLAMLPETEKNPVAERAIQTLARTTQERVVLLVRGADPADSRAAALALARDLEAAKVFESVQCELPPIDPLELVRFYAPYRQRLAAPDLPPGDLAPAIQARLLSPVFSGMPPHLDPLGAFGGFLAGLPFQSTGLELRDGLLAVQAGDGLHVMVTAALRGSAFDPVVQARSLGAVDAAAARMARPGRQLLRTGVLFYAADARGSAEREMNLISLLSTLGILGLFALTFRSLRHLLLGLACVAAGLASALAVCLLAYGKLHLLTLVVGCTVMGVAVDYAFLLFAHHLGAGGAWNPGATLRRILPALLLGLVTSLLGYGALLAAPFPGLRQIAVFSMVALAGSFLTVLLVLPDWLGAPLPPRPALGAALARILGRIQGWSAHRRTPLAVAAALALLGGTLAFSRVDDDVRGLILPSRALRRDEARIQELLKISTAGAFFLVEGADEGQVLAREEALRARMPIPGVAGLMAVSAFVPSPARQEAALARNRAALPALAKGMLDAGFRPEAAAAAREGLDSGPLTVGAWLGTSFSIPLRPFWLGPTERGAASVVLPTGSPDAPALARACEGLPGVTLVDKAGSVSRLLAHYRRVATWALAGAVALVGLLLGAWYGPRTSLRLLAPSLLGMLAALAAGAALGFPVTLFTVMALILSLGLGVDYTVFLRERDAAGTSALLGVMLASASTLISFGLLALSHTPSLRAFGVTLAAAVLVATLTSFLALGERA
ncbi:MMPL family transporter [Mesoterricola silvestris]|uniref:Membrane protein n=1 Tax=Mesoterricola silvestris TaxID=2927979 RepID=A0AA48H3Y0_9BACT|nr:MMPL family transporter [Mesoterricola silvestris]BDU71448.1 membrane protein [Mesoterricola silvestris]